MWAIFSATSVCSLAQELTNERAKWFTDARYGMFIHWGVYSGAEGVWKGERHRDGNNYAEWIQYRNRIDQKEYLTLLDRFEWDRIDPEKWVILAKNAGMKYVVITAKHHDGFALWDSKANSYNVAQFTNPQRDIIRELAAACKKHGLKLGLYYSHWIDWEHKYGWDHTKEITGLSNENYETSKLAEEFNIDPITPALNGGEDYELLFTIPLNDAQKAEQLKNVKIIGHITEEGSGSYIIGDDGSEVAISAQGWEQKNQ